MNWCEKVKVGPVLKSQESRKYWDSAHTGVEKPIPFSTACTFVTSKRVLPIPAEWIGGAPTGIQTHDP